MNINDKDYYGHYSNHDSQDFFVLENSSLDLVEEFDREVEDDVGLYTSNVAADVTVGNNYIYHGDVDLDFDDIGMVGMVEEDNNEDDDDEEFIDLTQNTVPLSPVTFTDVSDKKSVSMVWDYFKSVDNDPKKKYKNDEEHTFRCKCGKVYRYKSKNGTITTLLRHLSEQCVKYKETIEALKGSSINGNQSKVRVYNQSQLILNSSTQGILAFKIEPFTQEKSRQDLIEMIVVDDMPFTTAERPGFIKYTKGLRPDFELISRQSVKRDIIKRL